MLGDLNIDKMLPLLSYDNLDPFMCARYARWAARDHFGIKYEIGHAWFFSDRNRLIKGNISYAELQRSPISLGNVVSMWDPKSEYKHHSVTHVGLISNISKDRILIDHQYGSEFRRDNLDDLSALGFELRELITFIR